MPDEPQWSDIAATHYGLRNVRRVREIQCFSRHHILATHRSCFVLSQVDQAAGRLPFRLQFDILDLLRETRNTLVRRPIPTRNRAAFVTGPEHYWFLRTYRSTDLVFWRNQPQLVSQAATALARIHAAGTDDGTRLARLKEVDHVRLAPFYRTVECFLDTIDLVYRDFDDHELTSDDNDLLKRTLNGLHADRAEVLGQCRERRLTGITHHDYRPDNILVENGRIAEIIDWDCAFVDHQLYDVAYAAFQFGQRQRLRDTDLQGVDLFIAAYLDARGLTDLPERVIGWFCQFAVVKRLLINGRNAERMRLLRTLESRSRTPGRQAVPVSGQGRPTSHDTDVDLLPAGTIAQSMAI